MLHTSRRDSPRLTHALFLLIFGGMVITGTALYKAKSGIYTGVVLGSKSGDWPSVTSHFSANGTLGGKVVPWWPHYVVTSKRYHYKVDGVFYQNNDYDVNGPFFYGTLEDAKAFRNLGWEIPVYYNPEDPSQSLLRKGVSLDPATIVNLRFASFGVLILTAGVAGLVIRRYRSARKDHKKDVQQPEAHDT